MYSSFTFLELVKAISVHRAHRLLPEATLILCTWRNRLSVTVSGFDRLLSGNATNYRRKNTRIARCSPTLRFARQETVNLVQNTPRAHFTDEVNYIIDNEKQKALLVGVRSPRACVTMPSAANQ
jgi:hypothetical protein